MATAIDLQSYQEPILFLATAGIVVPLFHRLKISPVLGFLAAGALLGPYGLGRLVPSLPWVNWLTFTNPEGTSRLAEFGVVFLLFTIGIELSWQRLRTLRRLVFGFGSLQVLIGALILGLAFYAFKTVETITAATIVGLALALSSTAIVIPVLAEQKRLNTAAGRASFSALLFQDLLVAPILFAIAVLDTGKPEVTLSTFAVLLLQAGIALVVIIGLFDLLNTARVAAQDPLWLGFHTEAFTFVALIYFVGSTVMSQYGLWLERNWGQRNWGQTRIESL